MTEQATEPKYKYMVDDPQFPYCNGCGHTWINKSLDKAFQKLHRDPREINLVTDIGCVGLVDKLFLTNTVHTTHGRSTAFATGLQLADQIIYDKDTVHVIMIGDGGATLGLQHLVEAAKLNTNLTVILHNNFVYGMTGGQNSGLTPENFRTATTMDGNMVPPTHMAELLKAAHAGYISRKLATEPDLDDAIVEAINYPGFSLVEIIELCTGYATKWNKMSKNDVHEILVNMNSDEIGNIVKRDRPSYGSVYAENFPKKEVEHRRKIVDVTNEMDVDSFNIVVAGSAGEGVQFASSMFLQAGVANGLNVMQKNDNPVTIGTGFSLSELNFNKEPIYYSGIEAADFVVITSIDGFNRAQEFLKRANEKTQVIICDSLPEPTTVGKVHRIPIRASAPNKKTFNIVALGYLFKHLKGFNIEAYEEAVTKAGKNPQPTLDALRFGFEKI